MYITFRVFHVHILHARQVARKIKPGIKGVASLHLKIPQIVQMLAAKQPRIFFSAGYRVLVEDMELMETMEAF